MGHRKHSHESDKYSRVTCPVSQVLRSKSYPREAPLKTDHSSRHEHRKHKHIHHHNVDAPEDHLKKHHKDKKKHDKTEKNKYNIEKLMKEKHSKSHHHHHNAKHFKNFDLEEKSIHFQKPKDKSMKSFQDFMNLDYYVTPVHLVPEKEKYRSKSGEEKRQRDIFGVSHKVHSRSQDDCKRKEERKHSRRELEKEPSSPTKRTHHRKTSEKSDKKHSRKDKHSLQPPRNPTEAEALCSGLYKFFRLEKSEICDKDSGEMEQQKHFVSPHNSNEMVPTKKVVSRHKRKRNPKEPTKKKSEEDVKKYFLKIQNMIDEKLNFFLHKTLSNQVPILEVKTEQPQKREGHKSKKHKERDIPKLEIITIDDKPNTTEEAEIKRSDRQPADNEVSDENGRHSHRSRRKASLRALKSNDSQKNELSRHSSLKRNSKSDSTPLKSKTSIISEKQRHSTPKKIRALECKTVSIVSIVPQKYADRMKKTSLKSPEIIEDLVEKKKKSKCFQRYYNYEQIDAKSNSSAEKSIISDSFKNVTEISDKSIHQKKLEKKEASRFPKLEPTATKFFDINEEKVGNLPPYWNDKCQQVWRPQGVLYVPERENPLNFTQNRNLNVNQMLLDDNLIPTNRSIFNDGFIKLYSNNRAKFGESSLDSLLSKSSIQRPEHTANNLKFIVGSTQTATNEITCTLKKHTEKDHKSKAIEYVEYKNYFRNPKTECAVDKFLNKPFPGQEQTKVKLSLEQQNAAFKLPKSFISKLLEEVSAKRTNDVGVGTSEDMEFSKQGVVLKQKIWSHISIQADLLSNSSPRKGNDNLVKAKNNRVDAATQFIDTGPKKINIVKDQFAQVSRDRCEIERDNKKTIGVELSRKSLGISTSLPFLQEPRIASLRSKRSESLKGTTGTMDSTVASLICVHRFHGDKISSSNKSNNQSVNEFYIKPIGTSHRRSTLFLTKQYRPGDQSSYQKRKMYDEKIRKKNKRRNQHSSKDFTPQVFEVRFVTVENSSQSNQISSTRDYVNPDLEEKQIDKDVFSYALQHVDMLWKNKKIKFKHPRDGKGATSETVDTQTDQSPRHIEEVPNLKGIIDCICKSLVTYYHNGNFSDSATDMRMNKKTVEALYKCDHFHKNSTSSYSLSDTDSRTSATDSRFTKSFGKTSTSSGKCFYYNNSGPTSNSADSFFDYPYGGDRYMKPTILGYALDNKTYPPDPCKKKESLNDVSLSEESGYGTDEKTEMSKNFFKRPTIAALLEPHQKIFADIYFCQTEIYQKEFDEKSGYVNVVGANETGKSIDTNCIVEASGAEVCLDESANTLADKQWSRNFDSCCSVEANLTESGSKESNSTIAARQWSRHFDSSSREIVRNLDAICSQKEVVAKNVSFNSHCTDQTKIVESLAELKGLASKEKIFNQNSKSIQGKNSSKERSDLYVKELSNTESTFSMAKYAQVHPFRMQDRYIQSEVPVAESSRIFIENLSTSRMSRSDIREFPVETKCSQIGNLTNINNFHWKPTKEEKLFEKIEKDLREIYDPTETPPKSLGRRIKTTCKSIFNILSPRRKSFRKVFKNNSRTVIINKKSQNPYSRTYNRLLKQQPSRRKVLFQVIVLSCVTVFLTRFYNVYVHNL